MKAVKEYNDKAFQKRDGSRSSVFNTQEKTYLRALPFIPYEVCEWSYGDKVGKNSHISFNKGQYSVPCRYIGNKVDVKFNSHLVFIYYNRTEIARHEILPKGMVNGVRTEESQKDTKPNLATYCTSFRLRALLIQKDVKHFKRRMAEYTV